MRNLKLLATLGMTLATGASAAVAAIPTGADNPIVVERPEVTKRAVNSPAPFHTAQDDIPRIASIIASEAHAIACIKHHFTDAEDCPISFFPPQASKEVEPSMFTPSVYKVTLGDLPGVITPSTVPMVTKRAVADEQSGKGLGQAIASFAHSIACEKAIILNAYCDSTARADEKRNADPTTTVVTTATTTSTVYGSTVTVPQGQLPPSPASLGFAPPKAGIVETSDGASPPSKIAMLTLPTTGSGAAAFAAAASDSSTTCTESTGAGAVTIVNTTVSVTTFISATPANSRPSDTNTYLNISTWTCTDCSFTFSPSATSGSNSTSETSSKSKPTSVNASTTPASSTMSDDTMGFTGAVTSAINNASGKSVTLVGIHVPAGMIAAMGVCFGLALIL